MAILKCKICGGELSNWENQTIVTCEYCGNPQTIKAKNKEYIENIFQRANALRLRCDFDKAEKLYERIIEEDPKNAEAYWGIILCRYGIVYVDDPKTGKRLPTCNRVSNEVIVADEDYKMALQYADVVHRNYYEMQAKEFDRIQKEILAISSKEEPFDVFICYKEKDEKGKRTYDSVIANQIYHELTKEGLKVFYAAITLEDKLGSAYEPIIFAALNSSKVMIVLGTKPEYFNAIWVKNEWSRFLNAIKKGERKLLIPAYRGMDPYELPEEFSHLQAQDMSKIGFLQDLIRGIKKVVVKEENPIPTSTTPNTNPTIRNLLRRVSLFLEEKNWEQANEYCERILDIDMENGEAYLYKLCIECQISKIDDIVVLNDSSLIYKIKQSSNYRNIIKFGDDKTREKINHLLNLMTENNNSSKYFQAKRLFENNTLESYEEALNIFKLIRNYRDSVKYIEKIEEGILQFKEEERLMQMERIEQANEQKYLRAKQLANTKTYSSVQEAITILESIINYKDSNTILYDLKSNIKELKKEDDYNYACRIMYYNDLESVNKAISIFERMYSYRDAYQKIQECNKLKEKLIKEKDIATKRDSKKLLIAFAALIFIWPLGLYLLYKYFKDK